MSQDRFAEYRKHRRSAMTRGLATRENGIILVLAVAILLVWALAWRHWFPITTLRSGAGATSDTAAVGGGEFIPPDRLTWALFDVGQGDASLFLTPAGNVFLIDGGEGTSENRDHNYSRATDAGNRVILPFLQGRQVKTITAIFLTHPHSDHYGGLVDVIRALATRTFYNSGLPSGSFGYRNLLQMVEKKKVNYLEPVANEPLNLDPKLGLRVLAVDPTADNTNNASIVLQATFGSVRFLLMGDAEAKVEDFLVRTYGSKLRAEVIKVGHHGSKTSCAPEFIAAVSPKYATVSVGSYNNFGHPNQEVMDRLKQAGAVVLRTDQRGTITFTTGGDRGDLQVETAKQ